MVHISKSKSAIVDTTTREGIIYADELVDRVRSRLLY